MVKRCSTCLKVLDISFFTKQKQGKFGVRSRCKTCLKKEDYKWLKSKNGVISQILTVQKVSSKKRKMDMPSYSKKELKDWLLSKKEFHSIYNQWVKGGYRRAEAVSVDRLDDYKPYSLDNIQILTWSKNRDKRHSDVVSGINNKQSRAVIQMSLDDKFLKEYYSIHQASRETKICVAGIHNACSGKYKTSGKFKWKFADDKTKGLIDDK